MPNVNVYVPNPLAKRLEPFKDRLKVSEICQAALEAAITAEEAVDRGNRLPRIINRLERTLSPSDMAQAAGRDVGRDWGEATASMAELQQVAELSETAEDMFAQTDSLTYYKTGGVGIRWKDDGKPDAWRVLPDTVPQAFFKEAAEGAFFDAHVYGFISGATDLWEDVQKELQRRVTLAAVQNTEGAQAGPDPPS
jgi:hypothetical protein